MIILISGTFTFIIPTRASRLEPQPGYRLHKMVHGCALTVRPVLPLDGLARLWFMTC